MEQIGQGLHSRFLRGLAVSPDRAAVRVGNEEMTYSEMHRRALELAGAVSRVSPARSWPVGLLTGRSIDSYLGVLAVLYSGIAVVPLPTSLPHSRLAQMMEATGIKVVLADAEGWRLLPQLPATTVEAAIRIDSVVDGAGLPEPCRPRLDEVAYILFTSGSTGRPKGVPITHGNLQAYFSVIDSTYDFDQDDVFSQTFELSFDCSIFDLFCAWRAGATLVPVSHFAYRNLPGFMARHGITVWFSTPSSIRTVRRAGGLGPGRMPNLRWSFFIGEAFASADAVDWEASAPRSRIVNLYGPTELTISVSAHEWSRPGSVETSVNGVVPIGALHSEHERLLLTDTGDDSAEEGELCVAGPQLTPGYLETADNEHRFFERSGKRWYRTGDKVRLLPGDGLAYLGRVDDQVQVRGWRVELAEIDFAVRSCPGIEQAVSVGIDRDGTTELGVFFTGGSASVQDIREHMRAVLPEGLIPGHFWHVGELPLTANRKIDRKSLTAQAARLLLERASD